LLAEAEAASARLVLDDLREGIGAAEIDVHAVKLLPARDFREDSPPVRSPEVRYGFEPRRQIAVFLLAQQIHAYLHQARGRVDPCVGHVDVQLDEIAHPGRFDFGEHVGEPFEGSGTAIEPVEIHLLQLELLAVLPAVEDAAQDRGEGRHADAGADEHGASGAEYPRAGSSVGTADLDRQAMVLARQILDKPVEGASPVAEAADVEAQALLPLGVAADG